MNKLIIFIVFFYAIPLFSGTGTIKIKNNTKNNIIIKITTTTDKEYKETIGPKNIFEKNLSRATGTPDIKDMIVEFPDKEQVEIDGHKIKGLHLDYRRWTHNVNIKNNKTTLVEIFYNQDKNRFERTVKLDDKFLEKKSEYIGDSAESAMLFINKTPYKLILHIMVDGSLEWETLELDAYDRYMVWPGKSGGTTNDLDHMAVEFKKPSDVKKSEKRWWRDVIDNKKNTITTIYIDYDKTNKRFTRSAYRNLKNIESKVENIGIKFKGDYKLLPTRPNKRQNQIRAEIIALKTKIAALEIEKKSLNISRNTAKIALEQTLFLTLGLSDLAQQASEGMLSLFNIKSAILSGSITDFVQGRLPKLEIDCEIIDKPHHFIVAFDFAHPENTFKSLGNDAGAKFEK
ncbi:hypothetical protein KJ644_00875 [Candidatus Dependentiae bacterium]|nr:hypothetical protein [Candidatus Dependentiae bacterium]MBU4387006.1 hypothetical protein [Candidatus Dependentiae bacterium]MCG2756667.1 hypothetical protein [Candidatus Dependentiae bacterium]